MRRYILGSLLRLTTIGRNHYFFTNFRYKLTRSNLTSQELSEIPIMEVKRNPHNGSYAVFFKMGYKDNWKELVSHFQYGRDSRTRFRWLACMRMYRELEYYYRKHNESFTKDKYI